MKHRGAFTLIELMVVLGIMVVLSFFVVLSLSATRNRKDLTNTANEIVHLLRDAQERSMTQLGDTAWGVHFDNTNPNAPFYALFSGTYSTNTRTAVYPLPSDVAFASTTLGGGATCDITFAQVTGLPSTSTTITLDLASANVPRSSSTIRVDASGLISY